LGRIAIMANNGLEIKGAGGSEGGIIQFIIGLAMMLGGGYLFLNSIHVMSSFGMGYGLYRMGGMNITSGMVLIPFMIGIAMVFYDSKNYFGWVLAIGSVLALVFGVIATTRFTLSGMSLFDLLMILVLFFGGLGLLLNSLRDPENA